MLPIVFYFPYPDIGGVSVLFLRLAAMVSRQRRVIIMDMENGYMARHLPANCEFIAYNKPKLLPSESILVTQSCPLWCIPYIYQFPSNTKIFFWNLHPNNLNPLLSTSSMKLLKPFVKRINKFSYLRKRKIGSLVRYLNKNNAIYFMDKENADRVKSYLELHNLCERYLPIMTGEFNENYEIKSPEENSLKCVWVGRLDDFKIPILLHTIKRLDQIDSISLDIIGDGLMRQQVINECRRCKNLKTRLLGSISNDDLGNTLSKFHILFAMGTSALEGAKIGLPTICVDFSYNEIKCLYKYRMLYENIGYNVGEEITCDKYEKISTLEDLLRRIKDNYKQESRLSYEYWKSNHNPSLVIKYFINAVDNSKCVIEDLIELMYHKADLFTILVTFILGSSKSNSGFILR